jgi:hypothetical protein
MSDETPITMNDMRLELAELLAEATDSQAAAALRYWADEYVPADPVVGMAMLVGALRGFILRDKVGHKRD